MRLLAVAALTSLLFAGCSDDGGDDASPESENPGLPMCANVWLAGETLPEDYDGCENEDGGIEAAVTQECTDGSLFTGYQDRYWAILGGEIKDSGAEDGTSDSPDYAADYAACFAD